MYDQRRVEAWAALYEVNVIVDPGFRVDLALRWDKNYLSDMTAYI
jgi:hypothetical protein